MSLTMWATYMLSAILGFTVSAWRAQCNLTKRYKGIVATQGETIVALEATIKSLKEIVELKDKIAACRAGKAVGATGHERN